MRRYRKVETQVNTVNSNSRNSSCRYSLFSKENPIIRISYLSGCLVAPINPDKRSCDVLNSEKMTPTGEKNYSEKTLSKCHSVQNKPHMNWSGIEPVPRRCLKHSVPVNHHHHKHQGFDPLIRSVSTVTAARGNASSVFQLFSFLVVCSGMISKGFGFVAFFASVKASSVFIHLTCLVCL